MIVADGVTRVSADFYAHEYGVAIGIRVAFAEDRRVTGARLVWDGNSSDIAPYPLDGTDPDVALEFLDLDAGEGVLLEGLVLSACPDPPDLPTFEVQTILYGEQFTERYIADNASLFDNAFRQFCQFPLSAHVALSHSTPEGEYTVTLRLVNPGPATVTVVSEGVTIDGTAWQAATVDVLAGTRDSLTVHGHGPANCAATAPWETGHLLAGGRPLEINDGTWC